LREIREAVNCVIDSGWYLLGNEVKRFENNYAKFIGTKHCIGVANGLDALRYLYFYNISYNRKLTITEK
jgi:dTDP-4-amino-4,6-dideoxygalactose transaminase